MSTPSEEVQQKYGYLQACELAALKRTIDELPNGSICVNIGAGFGTSGLAFIESKNVGKLFTIDINRTNEDNGLGSLEFEASMFWRYGYADDPRFQQVHSDSAQCAYFFSMVDMVFIDGDHSYDHCIMDIRAWLPKIKSGGIISFHDYGEPNWPGVKQAVDELVACHYDSFRRAATFAAFRISKEQKDEDST